MNQGVSYSYISKSRISLLLHKSKGKQDIPYSGNVGGGKV